MPKQRGRVIVVGSSNTDLVVHCDCLPSGGETVLGDGLQTFAGGKGANQAVAAERAGAKVLFIGAFGDDAFGKARRKELEKEGIDCRGCVTKKRVPSGVALIAIGKGGKGRRKAKAENQIVVAPGANLRLTADDVKRGLPKDLGLEDVVLGSLEVPLAALETAFEAARKAGATAILNPAPVQPKSKLKKLLKLAAVVTPNEHEFEALIGASPNAAAHRNKIRALMFPNSDCCQILVTCGSTGVLFYAVRDRTVVENAVPISSGNKQDDVVVVEDQEFVIDLECTPVRSPKVKAVDTVGAGDCFNGALAARWSEDFPNVDDAVCFAVAAAAISVTRHGAQASMPRRSEILKMLNRVKG